MKKSIKPDTLAYPCPVWCVGSYAPDGTPNVMTIAWGGICNSMPPSVTVSLRKATATYGYIMDRQAYTVSIPSVLHVAEADYFGMVSGKNTNKFQDTGLTPVSSDVVDAPYVDEFPLILECKVAHTLELGLHTQFVGEILNIRVDENALDAKDKPIMEKIAPFVFGAGQREYHALGQVAGQAFGDGKKYIKKQDAVPHARQNTFLGNMPNVPRNGRISRRSPHAAIQG